MIFNSENEEITLQEKWAQDAESGMKITPPKKKAHDVDLRTGVKQCQWCSDDLTGDDVAEINGKVVCPSCAEGYRRGKAEDEKKKSPEIVWLDAMDNEALSIPKALRGTEEGQRLCRQRAKENIGIYAEMFHVDVDKCRAYARAHAFDSDQAGPGLEWQGLQIVVESPKGTERNGATMPADYGYINGFNEGADGDRVDCYLVGDAPTAYVVDQLTDDQQNFDEHKVVLGADSERTARKLYVAGHTRGKDLLGAITAMPAEVFKVWLKAGDTTQPVAWRPKQ